MTQTSYTPGPPSLSVGSDLHRLAGHMRYVPLNAVKDDDFDHISVADCLNISY